MKPNKPKANIIIFFVLLLLLPIVTIILPKKEFSENENRYLEEFPKPTLSSIKDKSL